MGNTLGVDIAARNKRQKINLAVICELLNISGILFCNGSKGCIEVIVVAILGALPLAVVGLVCALVHKSCNTRLNGSLGDAYIV